MSLPQTKFSLELHRREISTVVLSKLTGYPIPTVASWRRGARTPSRGAQALIAEALGVSRKTVAAWFGISATGGVIIHEEHMEFGVVTTSMEKNPNFKRPHQ